MYHFIIQMYIHHTWENMPISNRGLTWHWVYVCIYINTYGCMMICVWIYMYFVLKKNDWMIFIININIFHYNCTCIQSKPTYCQQGPDLTLSVCAYGCMMIFVWICVLLIQRIMKICIVEWFSLSISTLIMIIVYICSQNLPKIPKLSYLQTAL